MDEHHRWQLQLYESLGKAREPSGDRLDRLETDVLALKARPHSVSDFVDLNDTPAGITNGDIYYGSSNALVALGIGAESTILKVASGVPSWNAGGGGGLVLEATDTADGTAEHLQVTATSTPSSIKRMQCRFRSLVPEIDGDTLFITVIDSADTEITSASYYREGWLKTNGSALTGNSGAATSVLIGIGNVSNSTTDRELNVDIELMSDNTAVANTRKHFKMDISLTESTAGLFQSIGFTCAVLTSNSIKGFRIDTDNAGDTITSGKAELWVQT